jgi:hypothetical protein
MAKYSRTYVAAKLRKELLSAAVRFKDLSIAEKRPGHFLMRCPFHKQGKERTPSLWVTADASNTYFFRFRCFGCPEHGRWPKLAAKLRCDPIITYKEGSPSNTEEDLLYYAEAVPLFDDSAIEKLFGRARTPMPNGLEWPDYANWRTIAGNVVKEVGGVLYIDRFFNKAIEAYDEEERLAFPLIDSDGNYAGFVKANLKPRKGEVNYFNSPGLRSSRHLLFVDSAQKLISRLNEIDPANEFARLAFISEGPRDGLNGLQYGYPSVCNLGAYNSWSTAKVNTLISLGIDLLIGCMDGDEAGQAAHASIVRDVSDSMRVHTIQFPVDPDTGKKLRDFSDLEDWEINRLVKKACAIYNMKPPPLYNWAQNAYA